MDSIYIAHTPYHLIVACGYARKYDSATEKHLIIVSDFDNAKRYFDSIQDWDNCPFVSVEYLPGKCDLKRNILTRNLLQKANVVWLKNYLNDKIGLGCTAYIFNDTNILGQVCAFQNKKLGGCNIYVEDGYAAYGEGRLPHPGKIHLLLSKLIYGNWYQYVEILGKSTNIDRIMVFDPNNVRSELKSTNISELPRDILTDLDLELISKLLNEFNAESVRCHYEALIILPHSEDIQKHNPLNVKRVYLDLINKLQNSNYSVGIKYHPLEPEPNYLNIDFTTSIGILPREIPIEMQFYGTDGTPPKFVIGDLSTGLLTAKIILEEETIVFSINNIIKPDDQGPKILNKVGIIQPKSINDLMNYILYHET